MDTRVGILRQGLSEEETKRALEEGGRVGLDAQNLYENINLLEAQGYTKEQVLEEIRLNLMQALGIVKIQQPEEDEGEDGR